MINDTQELTICDYYKDYVITTFCINLKIFLETNHSNLNHILE